MKKEDIVVIFMLAFGGFFIFYSFLDNPKEIAREEMSFFADKKIKGKKLAAAQSSDFSFNESVARNRVLKPILEKRKYADFLLNRVLGPEEALSVASIESFIEASGGKLKKREDRNQFTGTMLDLTTEKSFGSVQLFKAHFFKGRDGYFPQHVSMVLDSGDKKIPKFLDEMKRELSLADNISVHKNFPNIWHRDNGYVFWVRELKKRDIMEDSSFQDRGIKVGAVEFGYDLDIH